MFSTFEQRYSECGHMAVQVPTEDPYDWVYDHRTGDHWVFLCMLTVPQKTGKAVQELMAGG